MLVRGGTYHDGQQQERTQGREGARSAWHGVGRIRQHGIIDTLTWLACALACLRACRFKDTQEAGGWRWRMEAGS